ERAQPRPERRYREVRQAEQSRHGSQVADHRVDLLRPDHGDRDDGRLGANRGRDKPAPAEPPQTVAISEALARAPRPLRKDQDELVALEEAPRVVGVADRLARAT